jgi:hypothetical protein
MTSEAWAAVAAVAAVIAAMATFLTPIIALQITERLQERREQKRLRLHIFTTLMQHRHYILHEDSVRSLNLIDAVYFDVKPVREAWIALYESFGDQRLNSPEGGRIRDDKRSALLLAMAAHLGLGSQFSAADFSRVYFPEALLREHEIRTDQQNQLWQALETARRSAPGPHTEGGKARHKFGDTLHPP